MRADLISFRRKIDVDPIERLEKEANDDFRLLDELGPEYFGSEHLLDLRERLRGRLFVSQRRQRLGLIIGTSACGWFLLAVTARLMGYFWIGIIALVAAAAGIAVFFWMLFRNRRPFESKGSIEHDLFMIDAELRRRAGKQQQQRY